MLLRSLALGLFLAPLFLFAQTRIDADFSFQTDPAKKYSLYIPSTYNANEANALMVGFHPFNTNRWDAEAWCDTLINFAETNGLILACPDGGADGRVDDPLDTAFTTALMDSVMLWYNINPDKVYAMGFSVGGRATYTYGLNHINRFGGFIPIGAAVNGTNEVNGVIQNASGKPYYLVHGDNDAPTIRFFPLETVLNNNGAIVESLLMAGIGHTIDFPNRNQILTDAFEWIDSVNCASVDTANTGLLEPTRPNLDFELQSSNVLASGDAIVGQLRVAQRALATVRLLAVDGRALFEQQMNLLPGDNQLLVNPGTVGAGLYLLHVRVGNAESVSRLWIGR